MVNRIGCCRSFKDPPMFLQTGGGGKGIRPNQQQQQQQHHQQQQQQHHQTHHPHSNLQQQQHQQPPHLSHQQQQQSHSHHPHQPQQHHLHHQSSHQATPYYSFQLSQQPPPQQQHQQHQHQQGQNVQAPSPPSQATGTPASSATSSNSSLSMAGIGNGGGGSNSNSANITRQHYGHPNAAAAIMQTPTTTTFMTTTYLQQQYHQQSAVMAAAAAAQYNTVAGAAAAAAAAAGHSPQTATQSAQSLYVQTQQQQHQQQQQQQHHQTLHQTHHQPTLHTHYYHPTAGAPPTPPPHLHPAHHHQAQQHQLRGVLTAPHQRQTATYLLPASAIFALPPGSLAAAPPPRSSLLTTHQQSGATGAPVSVTPLLQTAAAAAAAARSAVAGGGPTTYITQPFCQPPLPMGATTLTQPPTLLATAASIAPPTLQTYGHLPAPTASTSSTSLNTTETVKPRKHAIPIIHPITHENILDPKPQKKSAAVEAKPSATVEQSSDVILEQQQKAIAVSISKDNDKSTMPTVPKIAPAPTSSKEKIDQQMQTDAIKDKSSSTKIQFKANTNLTDTAVLESPTASISAASNLEDEEDYDVLYTHSKKLEQELPQDFESDANDEYIEDVEEHITVVVEELASQVTNEANYDHVDESQVTSDRIADDLQYEENQFKKDKNQQNQFQPEMHDEISHVAPHDFAITDIHEFVLEDHDYTQQNAIIRDPISKSTSVNQQESKEKSMRQVKTIHQQQLQQPKIKSIKQTTSNVLNISCTTAAAPPKIQTIKQLKLTTTSTSIGATTTTPSPPPTIKPQKLTPATSGASSSSTTSTPTHSSNMQQQHQQHQQQQQQKSKTIATGAVGGGASNQKRNKRAAGKASQKKLKQQTTIETSNRNNSSNSSNTNNNNNNKNAFNNVCLTNNNIHLMTDINSARISNINLRETIATNAEEATEVTGKLSKKQHFHQLTTTELNNNSSGNSATSVRSISTKLDSKCDSLADDSTPSTTGAILQAQRKHLKTQEIVAQYLQPTNSKAKSPEELQLQFLNSSASACEDEEEINARLQLQQQQHQQQEETAAKDIRFGDFTDDKEPTVDVTPTITTATFSKIVNTSRTKSSILASDTVDFSNSSSIATSTGISNKGTTALSKSYKNSGTTPKARQMQMLTPHKSIKYSLEELKSYAVSSEARKPPLVPCQKGDCISQLFVSRQPQHHLGHHHGHNLSPLALQQHLRQQYQHINFNESMEFVPGKRGGRGGHAKKPHEHQAVGASGAAGTSGTATQPQRKMEIIRVHLSLKEEIKLSECENAWQPETLRSHSSNNSPSGSNDDIDAVLKKVRGILNKLTPDNFDVLLKTMTTISINTQEKMQQVMLLIFEKTISEPNFAPTYAKFCKVLFHEIKAENKSHFTGSLITRIQEEFESNVNDADAKKLKLQPLVDRLENCADTKERLELQAEVEDQEYQFRRRAWGTVRFIGEMYKLQSLTSDRVLQCIESLLKHGCEEKLEYMCKLLTTVGHLLEGNAPDQYPLRMDKVFRKIQEFVHKSSRPPAVGSNKSTAAQQPKISSRVRFMMQDVMDLRARSWDQPLPQTQARRNASKPDDRSQTTGNASGNVVATSASIYEKNTTTSSTGGGGGGSGGGGRLTYGNQNNSRQTRQSPTEQRESNYFLQKPMKFSAQQDQQQQRQEKIELLKLKFSCFDDLTQSNTQLGNSSNYIWQNTIARQPSNVSATSTTTAGLPLNSNSAMKNTSYTGAGVSMKRQNTNQFQVLDKQEKLLETTQNDGDDEKLSYTKKDSQKLLNRLIEEVLDTRTWHKEALDSWKMLNTKQQVILMQFLLTEYLHLAAVKRQQRKACAKLFAHLLQHDANFKRSSVFVQAYKQFGEEFPDLLVDVPNGWTYVFDFLGPLLHERLLQFSDIWLPEWAEDSFFTEKFVKALVSHFTQEFGANYAHEIWHKEFKLDNGQIFFMNDAQKAANFLVANKFQHICERDAKPPKPHISSNAMQSVIVAEQLERIEFLLKTATECDLAIDYVNTNVHINTNFIRNLTKFFCCDYATITVIPNLTGHNTNNSLPSASLENSAAVQINMELFRKKCIPLLRLCIDGHEMHEIACLDAIVNSLQQFCDTDLEEASETICSIFDILDECDIIPKECFEKWYKGLLENEATAVDDGFGGPAAESGVATDSKRSRSDVKLCQQQKNRLTNKLHAYMEKIL